MTEKGKENILVMAVLTVTKKDVLACANELGIPEEEITDDVIELMKEKIGQSLGHWKEVAKAIVKEAFKNEAIECPLGLVCSSSCAWREVGECILPRKVK